jgi:hypothetical protein
MLMMCPIHHIAYVEINLEENHRWAVKWMQRRSDGPNGGGICIPKDLGTYNNFIKD